MKIFKNTAFHNWTKKLDISDKVLSEAIKEMARIYLNLTDEELTRAALQGELIKLEV